MSEKCSEYSYEGRLTWRCSRPVKDEGMCAQHLAGKRRREANDAKNAGTRRADNELRQAVEAQCAHLAELGIQAHPDYSGVRLAYTGRVIVDPAQLIALLAAVK